MKSAGKARNNGLYRHIRTSKEIIRNLLNDCIQIFVKFLCLLQNVSKFNIFRQRFLKYNLLVIFHNMCC